MPPFKSELWDEEPFNNSPLCFVKGPIIVGAGPSGLAVAACLKDKGIPSLIIERYGCIASLWRYKTYDRIHLHLPKRFCQLPLYPIPEHYPTYLSRTQYLAYLDDYCNTFEIKPRFKESVARAWFDEKSGLWRVRTSQSGTNQVRDYAGHWLIVASGENADPVIPSIPGLDSFKGGSLLHSSYYKNAQSFKGRKVLVVGCGNSGMEIVLDLIQSNAIPSLVVRDKIHVLPHSILGGSTYSIIVKLTKLFPVRLADRLLLICAWFKWKNTASCGLPRPAEGPIAYKTRTRRTPVLDIGTLPLIKNGQIKIFPGVKTITPKGAVFVNGQFEEFDDVILATGYRSNVKDWLFGENDTFDSNGIPAASPHVGWKGKHGLYTAGLSGMGLPGTTRDARCIVDDITTQYWSLFPEPK